ncbi:hypothetical protein C8J57DRAFT_1635453 [Mycena rebaudengoi]|nr:hypothetical protein C8J57DRAFT_1635453 [Mycena rebaudengoi]
MRSLVLLSLLALAAAQLQIQCTPTTQHGRGQRQDHVYLPGHRRVHLLPRRWLLLQRQLPVPRGNGPRPERYLRASTILGPHMTNPHPSELPIPGKSSAAPPPPPASSQPPPPPPPVSSPPVVPPPISTPPPNQQAEKHRQRLAPAAFGRRSASWRRRGHGRRAGAGGLGCWSGADGRLARLVHATSRSRRGYPPAASSHGPRYYELAHQEKTSFTNLWLILVLPDV